jgi:hypothetical protein
MDLNNFDDIRPYTDQEAEVVLKKISKHPVIHSVMKIINPLLKKEEIEDYFQSFKTIDDFQRKFSYPALRHVIDKTSDGLQYEGVNSLEKDKAYTFISTHRDIMLDTSLLNFLLLGKGLKATESAIGDNLVKRKTINSLSRLNRNFIVKRSASGREMLQNSKHLSEYIQNVLHSKKRSVWIAQREGRTKDGIDQTNSGLLKMLMMAASKQDDLVDYLKGMNIVPLSISYEYDPTDRLKISELIAKENNETYLKDRNEDFQQIVTGIIGKKKRMKLVAGKVLNEELDSLRQYSGKKFVTELVKLIDLKIVDNYQLWPTNFLAYDILNNTKRFSDRYNEVEEKSFLRRIEIRAGRRIEELAEEKFLEMYANPIVNKENLGLEI